MQRRMHLSKRTAHLQFGGSLMAIATLVASPSLAETIISQPGNHTPYSIELEPHLLLGWASIDADNPFPRAIDFKNNSGFGPGLRLSIPLVHNGFVQSINNGVALGIGLDLAHYGPNSNVLWMPVVMQWNFYVTNVITVFGEPGGALRSVSANNRMQWRVDGVLQLGAKFMLSRRVGLTLRAGFPYFSAGVTVLL